MVITDQLSEGLDWSTLSFTAFGFGDNNLSVPAGRQYHFAVERNQTLNGCHCDWPKQVTTGIVERELLSVW